jgi:glycosyltransferase involved in cell wall biosynthesis
MRVLHLIENYLPWQGNGTEIYCHRLCKNLQVMGVDVLVAFHQASSQQPIGTHEYEGVPIRVLEPIPDSGNRVAKVKRITSNPAGFAELLKEYQPDVLHVHGFTVKKGLSHIHLAKQAGSKIVLTFHTPGVSCLQKGLRYQKKEVCDGAIKEYRCTECKLTAAGVTEFISKGVALGSPPWISLTSPGKINHVLTARKLTALHKDAWFEMLNAVDSLHVLAKWTKEVALLNHAPPEKVDLIRTGGPEAVPKPNREPLASGYLELVFVGRCASLKGIHVVVEAVNSLPTTLPVRVTFFGQSWDENDYGRNLQKQTQGDERFVVKNSLPNYQLLETLTSYDACLVPSLWLETGPLTVLEAFAAGIPVIGSRRGGIAELVQDGVDGLLFEPENSKQLANVIEHLYEEQDLLPRLTDNVKPPRTAIDVATETRELYKKLQKL